MTTAMSNGYSKEIAAALHEVMGKVGYVQKTKRNAFHGYNYAGEGDLLEVLRPAMIDAGLILIPSMVESTDIDEYGNTRVVVEYTLAHKSGAVWPDKIRAAGCGNDKNTKGVGDKGIYKALTGANKYLLFKLFQIETGDDPEKDEHESTAPANDGYISAEQAIELERLAQEVGADKARFLAYMQVPEFIYIASKDFGRAKASLDKKRKAA